MKKYLFRSFTSMIIVVMIIVVVNFNNNIINLRQNCMFAEAVGNRTPSNSSSSTITETVTETSSKTLISNTRSATKTSTRCSKSKSNTRTRSETASPSKTDSKSRTFVSKTRSPTKTKTDSHTVTHTKSETFSISNSTTNTLSSSISSAITATNSSTQSSSKSETITRSATPSQSHSVSLSKNESKSASVSVTATTSSSKSVTPSVSLSQTPSDTPSITLSNTSSQSASKTFSLTTSSSVSPTSSISAASSQSFTKTLISPTRSPTKTKSDSETFTHTASETPSISNSTSSTLSSSISSDITATNSTTQSSSMSETVTRSVSPSVTATPSQSQSISLSQSESNSESASDTPSASSSASITPTDTKSGTLSISNSAEETLSSSISSAITSTNSSTESSSTSETITTSGSPSASATPDESKSISSSQSESKSDSVSATASASFSPSHSSSTSVSSTVSLSPTPNDSPSITLSKSVSESASMSMSLSTSSSLSPTSEESASNTFSTSASDSPSITSTLSVSETKSTNESLSLMDTASRTVTLSKSSLPTESVSLSVSADPSMSFTQSITGTNSETASVSESPSASSSISATYSTSSSNTQTESTSISATVSTTSSESETATDSVSFTSSPSVSESVSLTETESTSRSASPSMTPDASASVSLSQSKSVGSPSRTSSISLSDTDAHTASDSVSELPPDATTRYCELFSASSIRQTDTATSILRSNLFDPYQYAPCCSTTNGGELNIIAPDVDLNLRPSVASCYAQLSNCTNTIRPNTFFNSSKPNAKNFSFIDCGGSQSNSSYIGLGKCVDAMVSCLLRASLTVYNQPFSRCPWAPAILASATLFRGIPSDQRGGLLVTQECIAFKKTIFNSATNCPSANFLSSCSDAIVAAGSVARSDFSDLSLDFAAKGIPGALRYGMAMRSPTCGNTSGTCFSPQSSSSSVCSCPSAFKRFVGYGPEVAFVASTNCWSDPVQLDFCRDPVDTNNVVSDIDFFVQTAPKDAFLDNPVFPGFYNASSGSLGSRRAQDVLECVQGHSLLSSCGCPQNTYFRRFLLPAPRALDGRVTRRWVTFCAPIETNVFIVDQGDGSCYQPLLKSTQVRGNFSCSCLAGSTTRAVPLAYINESTGNLGPGMLVICDQPPINFAVAQVVATAISALSGLIGGPAMALLQAAVITTLVDCNSDGTSTNDNALLPFTIGSGALSSWLTVVIGMTLIVILQLLLVVGFFFWRRLKVKDADVAYEIELKKQQEMELQGEDEEEYYYEEEDEDEKGATGDDEKDDDDHDHDHDHKWKKNSSQKEASTSFEFSENPLSSDPRKSPANVLKRRNSMEPHRRISRRNSFNSHSPREKINNNNNNGDLNASSSVTEIPASSDADSVFSAPSVAANKNVETKNIHFTRDDVIDHGEDAGIKSNENNNNSINASVNQTPLERTHSLSIPPTPQTNITVNDVDEGQIKDQSPANPAVIAPFSPASSAVNNNHQESSENSERKRRKNSSSIDFLSPRPPREQEHDQFFASVNEGSGPSSIIMANNLMGDADNSLKFQGSRKKSVVFLSPSGSNNNNNGEMPNGEENHQQEQQQQQQQQQQQPLEYLESFSRPGPSIHFIDPPPDDIEMPPIITRTVYKAIPAPFPGECALDSFKFACCMARFPYVSMLFGRLVFQGFAYDTVLLLARNPVGSVNGIAGGFGAVFCLAWTFSHLYLANYIQRFEVWVYREYVRAFDTLPKFVPRRVLPHGFWHNSPFLLAFRATVDLYVGNQKMLRHLSWFTYFRMIIIGIIVGVPASKENCIGVYIALLVIMWLSAIIFIAFRPHRRPIDDVINVLLSFLNGLMIIFIIVPTLGDANNIFLAIVYSALASMAFTFIYASCEFFWWNRVEVRVSEAHECKSIEQDKEAREEEIERRYDELDRWRELWDESEALALEFEAEERKMRRSVAKLERNARARVTFSTDADEARDQTQAARARRFSSISAGGISAEDARAESLIKRKMSMNSITKNSSHNNSQDLPSDEGEKMNKMELDGNEGGDGDDDDDDQVDETASTSTTTSLQAIRRMRMALRNKRSSIRFEGGDSSSFNFSGVPGENNNNNNIRENGGGQNGEELHNGTVVRRRRFAQAPAPAERARLAVADLQTDMSDAFAHRALDVLGFF